MSETSFIRSQSNGVDNGSAHASAYTGLNTPTFRAYERRKFQSRDPRNVRVSDTRAPCFETTANDWVAITRDALRSHMQSEGISEKELARKIGCNDRTAENYTQGRCAPSGINLLRCIAVIPELAAEVDRLAGMERNIDPEAERARMDLIRAAWRFADITNGKNE